MIAEILATGDEIRSGALVDSNSAYISEKLEEFGIEISRHHCVGDDIHIIVEILSEIGQRADFAVVTGGLGPTTDDITAQAAANAAEVDLVLNHEALSDILSFFEKLDHPMADSNKKQAMLPKSATCMRNPVGTAPGFSINIGKCRFYFVPGVPYEMKKMLMDQVIPNIMTLQGDHLKHNIVRTISTFGLPESTVGEKVAGITDKFNGIQLGLRAKFPEIQVKLYSKGDDESLMNQTLDQATQWIMDKLGKYAFSSTGSSMQKVVGDILRKKNATLAVAESCTGGLVADLLTNVAGSSDYFLFSGVTYSNDTKIKILSVRPEIIEKYGAVHEETVREMAEGARKVARATYGLATSGIAGPGGGSEDKPVGTVCIGLATPETSMGKRFHFSYGKRLMYKKRFAITALEILRRELLGIRF